MGRGADGLTTWAVPMFNEEHVTARRPPLDVELTPPAKEAAIATMKAHLERVSGRPRTRDDARQAFENLLGFFTILNEWKARADAEDAGSAARPSVPPPPHRTFRKSKKPRSPT
jgi:hypothetical protein